jgi:hypothetical protein
LYLRLARLRGVQLTDRRHFFTFAGAADAHDPHRLCAPVPRHGGLLTLKQLKRVMDE